MTMNEWALIAIAITAVAGVTRDLIGLRRQQARRTAFRRLAHGVGPGGRVIDFAEFHALTYAPALRCARSAAGPDREAALDAVQDAYAIMLRRWESRSCFTLGDNRAYILRIVYHKIMDGYRHQRRLAEPVDEQEVGADDPALDQLVDEMSLLNAVRAFLADQPPRRRAVAVLRFMEGCEYQEIAEILGMSTSTVRTHVERVRVLLQPYLDHLAKIDQGGDRS